MEPEIKNTARCEKKHIQFGSQNRWRGFRIWADPKSLGEPRLPIYQPVVAAPIV
jgi:hypothetical protein